jgi:IS5 family transposase
MLRIYLLQHWFNLSDPAVEEALYDSAAMRAFAGIDLGREPAPDETMVCKFRHLLERHELGGRIFAVIGEHLQAPAASPSASARSWMRPSSPHRRPPRTQPGRVIRRCGRPRRGNQWYFGMKAHVGVDSRTKLIHSVIATSANVHDAAVLGALLHGEETTVWGDRAYQGKQAAIRGGTSGARRHQPALPLARPRRSGGKGAQHDQVAGAGQGRAQHGRHQARVRLQQGALSRADEECASAVRYRGPGQPLHVPPEIARDMTADMHPPSARVETYSPHSARREPWQCPVSLPCHPGLGDQPSRDDERNNMLFQSFLAAANCSIWRRAGCRFADLRSAFGGSNEFGAPTISAVRPSTR